MVVATCRHHINDVFKVKKKTALPVIQKEKTENSERDESQKNGGRNSHTRAKIPQKYQQDQNRQVSLINTLT